MRSNHATEFDKLKIQISSQENNLIKLDLARSWLEKSEDNNFNLSYLQELTSLTTPKNWRKTWLAELWLSKVDNNFDSKYLEEILQSAELPGNKVGLLKVWLLKPENRTLNNIKKFLPSIPNGEGSFKLGLLRSYLSEPPRDPDSVYIPENNFTLDELETFLSHMPDDREKIELAIHWLAKPENKFVLEDETSFLKSTKLSNKHKAILIEFWLLREGNNLDFSYLKEILPWARDKDYLLKSWLAKPENNVDLPYIQKILPSTAAAEPLKASLAKPESGFNPDDLKVILPSIDVEDKLVLIKFCLSKIVNPSARYDCFVDLAKSNVFKSAYNTTQIGAAYTFLNFPQDKIPDLCRDLYPTNELLQVELFKEFLNQEAFNGEQKSVFREFIRSITSDQLVLNVVQSARASGLLDLNKQDILELSASRVGEQYQSLTASLKGRRLAESLTEAGLAVVVEEFLPQSIPANTDLAALFSYYDLQEGEAGMAKFKSILKPGVLQELSEQFVPSGKKPYISKVEKSKLTALLGERAIAPSFTEIAVLSDYLKSQVPAVPSLNEDTIARFSFGASALIDEAVGTAKRDRVTASFKELLRVNPADKQAVFNFFSNDLGCADAVNPENKDKLGKFFNLHKAELAFLFSKENGVNEFVSTISTLADGCAANIGTHFNNALLSSLLKDSGDKSEYNKVLYSVFVEKVVTPFFNTAAHVHGGERQFMQGADVLNHPAMKRDLVLSPVGLVEQINHEFCTEVTPLGAAKHNIDPTPVLRAGLGDEVASQLSSIAGVTPESLSKIATYLVLKNTLPQLLENRHLAEFKSSCERAIEAAKRFATASAAITSTSTAGGVSAGIASGARQVSSEAGVWPSVVADATAESLLVLGSYAIMPQ